MVKNQRELMPRIGTLKLYHMLQQKGIRMGRDALYRLLKENDLLLKPPKRLVVRTTQASHRAWLFKNLIKDRSILKPNQVWVADITYIRIKDGFAYLSLLTDAYSRRIVGWALHPTLHTEGCLNALSMAMATLSWRELKGIIHHSDRGCQYCSKEYVKILRTAQIKISVTQKGDPYENALAERVNGILKTEWLNLDEFDSFSQAQNRIREVVFLYNTKRLHMSHDFKTPDQVHYKGKRTAKKELKETPVNSFSTTFVNS